MGPGSVATALASRIGSFTIFKVTTRSRIGPASGRPSHHHAAVTAAAVRMNKATSFLMKIPCYADGVRLRPFEPARAPRGRKGKRLPTGRLRARRRTHSIDAPRRNPPRPAFARAGVRRLMQTPHSREVRANISVAAMLYDWAKSATSAIDDEENLDT